MDTIQFTSSPAWLALIALIAGLLSYMLYRKDKDIQKSWRRWLLGIMRFVAFFLIGLLLLNPLIQKLSNRTIPQRTILLLDQSESMGQWLSKANVEGRLNSLLDNFRSRSKEDVLLLGFDDQIRPIKDSISYSGQRTNIAEALTHIQNTYDPQSIGQVLLVSDGIFNSGSSPANLTAQLPFSVSTVLMGDTNTVPDLFIRRVLHSEVSFVGDEVIVQTDISSQNVGDIDQKLILEIYRNGTWKAIDQANYKLTNGELKTVELTLPIDEQGLIRSRVRTGFISREQNRINNSQEFYVDALRSRQVIHIVAAAPHPDIAAIKRSLSSKKNIEVKVSITDLSEALDPETDVYALHNMPSLITNNNQFVQKIIDSKKPILWINSSSADWASLNQMQDLVTLEAVKGQESNASIFFNKSFSLYEIEDQWRSIWNGFPPLQVPFGNISTNPRAQVLAYQQIGGIETSSPLVVIGEGKQQKMALILGNGLFRWPIYEYVENQNQNAFDEFVSKTLQYLSVREDKRKLRARLDKRLYQEGERILIQAELYNDSYEKITSSELEMKVTNESGDEFFYALSKIDDHYEGQVGPFDAGQYRYEISTQGNTVGSFKGLFAVETLNIEKKQLKADHQLLRNIATSSGGRFYTLSENPQEVVTSFLNNENVKPTLVEELSVSKWLDSKWVLALICLLLLTEWFLRRIFGSY